MGSLNEEKGEGISALSFLYYTGAGMVLKNGSKIIRPIILVVLMLLFIKIVTDL